jgi:hypothetical protein
MRFPFDFEPNAATFVGIVLGIVLVAVARAAFGF